MKTVIQNGLIVDGSGTPRFLGDILIEKGIIRKVGVLESGQIEGSQRIDAQKKIVCPGFIDLHRHCDLAVLSEGFGEIELRQGITTCLCGNCGMAPVPNLPAFREELFHYLEPCLGKAGDLACSTHRQYLELLQKTELPLNIGFLAGMGAIKIAARGSSRGPFTSEQMKQAREYLFQAMEAGAFGMSIGLMYVPEAYSSWQEVAQLAEVLSGKGILCAHMRWETEQLPLAVQEVIQIAKHAGIPLEISHFKAAGTKAWGKAMDTALELIERERAGGMDITLDFYPYDCGSSTMMQMLPPGFLSEGSEKAIAGLDRDENIQRLRRMLEEGEPGWDNLSKTIGWDRTLVSSATLAENQKYLGKSVSACAKEYGFEDEADFVARLLFSEQGRVAIINRSMCQEDIDRVVQLPYSMLISDALYGDMEHPHPRLTGAFPKFIREYVLERKLLSLEEAIRKMTLLPAQRLSLKDIGEIREGKRADILIWDETHFRDRSTYLQPMELCDGPDYALIGGDIAVQKGQIQSWNLGRVLQNTGKF